MLLLMIILQKLKKKIFESRYFKEDIFNLKKIFEFNSLETKGVSQL